MHTRDRTLRADRTHTQEAHDHRTVAPEAPDKAGHVAHQEAGHVAGFLIVRHANAECALSIKRQPVPDQKDQALLFPHQLQTPCVSSRLVA